MTKKVMLLVALVIKGFHPFDKLPSGTGMCIGDAVL